MMTNDIIAEACSYRMLENDIHEFIYHEASRRAVDEMTAHLDHILKAASGQQASVLVLTDSSQVGSQPIKYMIARLREVMQKNPQHPAVCSASLFSIGAFSRPADILFKMLSNRHQFRVFNPEDREKAIEWLRSEGS